MARSWLSLVVCLALVAGCATPDPEPANRGGAATAATTTAAPTGPVSSGVTSDPGTRYLTAGAVGALAAETSPGAPPASEPTPALEPAPAVMPPVTAAPAASPPGADLGVAPTGPLPLPRVR